MALNYLDSFDLGLVVKQVKPQSTFLKDKFFSRPVICMSDTYAYETETATDGLAHVVRKGHPAINVKKSTKSAKSMNLFHTYEEMTFSVDEFEQAKSLSNVPFDTKKSMYDEWVRGNTETLRTRIAKREEQLCAAALTGTITISNDNIVQTITYDYVENTHYSTLDSTNKWNASTSDPLASIRTIQNKIAKRTGLKADIVILGEQAAADFISNATLMKQLDYNNLKVGTLTPSDSANIVVGGQLIMKLPDGTEIYMYSQVYTAEDGTETAMIDTNSAFFGCSQAKQYLGYVQGTHKRFADNGTIQTFNYIYPSQKINDDRTMYSYKMASIGAPLMTTPDVFYKLVVHA